MSKHNKRALFKRIHTTVLIVVSVLALVAIVAAVKAPAHAQSCPCGSYLVKVIRDWPEFNRVERRCYRCPQGARVYGYSRRDDDERERPGRLDQCLSIEVDVLSTEHQTEDNAREAARKLWMAKVQWQLGGQYMSLDEAAHTRWRCGPSNAHDTVAGRLSETVGALTGKGGQNVRCALWARPCRTERTPGDERARR